MSSKDLKLKSGKVGPRRAFSCVLLVRLELNEDSNSTKLATKTQLPDD